MIRIIQNSVNWYITNDDVERERCRRGIRLFKLFHACIYRFPPSPASNQYFHSFSIESYIFFFLFFGVCVWCVYIWFGGDGGGGSGCSPIWNNSSKYRNLFTRLKSYINRLHNDKFQSRFSFSNGTICSRIAENARDTRTIYVANVYTRTQTTPLEIISLLLLFVAVTNLEDSSWSWKWLTDWMGRWVAGWLAGWLNGWLSERVSEWMKKCAKERVTEMEERKRKAAILGTTILQHSLHVYSKSFGCQFNRIV